MTRQKDVANRAKNVSQSEQRKRRAATRRSRYNASKECAAREAVGECENHKRRRDESSLEEDEERAARERLTRVAETRDRNAQLQMQSAVVKARKRQKTRMNRYDASEV